jgi:DNA phosphorothioation-dependent restriction protein DptH
MAKENKLYFYLSKLILDFFANGSIKDGSKYHIRFEKQEEVNDLSECLKMFAQHSYNEEGIEVGEYLYNDYQTYYLAIKNTKLIIASHENEDLLTGLRNNFQKIPLFSSSSSILFIHSSELESINKGAESLSNRVMPLHYETVSKNIIKEVRSEDNFSNSQKEFLQQLINAESSDYQIENSNVFDLKKYLTILINRKLSREDYNLLGVFFDDKIHTGVVPNREVKLRVDKNRKIYSDIAQHEQLGTLESYLERHFDKEGQKALSKREDWPSVSFDDLLRYEANRDNIKFNEYIPNTTELTEDGNVIWDRAEGITTSKSKIRNIILFNERNENELKLSIKFKKKPNLDGFEPKSSAEISEASKSIEVKIVITNAKNFYSTQFHYKENKDGKKNSYLFKLLVVPFEERIFRALKSNYIVQTPYKDKFGLELHADDQLVFNEEGLETEPITFFPDKSYELDDVHSLKLILGDVDITDSLKLPFTLRYKGATIFTYFVINGIRPTPLTGWGVWTKKNSTLKSVYYSRKQDERHTGKDIITLEHGNTIYFPIGEFREDLYLEEQLVDCGFPVCEMNIGGKLSESSESLPDDLSLLYNSIIEYFRRTQRGSFRLLPSTVYIDDELKSLYQAYIHCYLEYLEQIQNNDALSGKFKSLFRLGTIVEHKNLKRFKLTPLHPLVIAYQLQILENLDLDFFLKNNSEILQKLTPINLLPFINSGGGKKDYLIAIDQDHSPEWIYYVDANIEGQSINRRNVPEMMSGKIREFVKHFSFLYIDNNAPIRLNLINIGDGKEALQGVFEYFSAATRDLSNNGKNPNEIYPILINIYGSGNFITYFEQFSKFEDPETIKTEFGINLETLKGKLETEDFLKLYHEKVQFFIKSNEGSNKPNFEYAHITFHQFDEDDIEKSDNNTHEIATGISLEGLLSDLPSIYAQGNYRTGFGIKYQENFSNTLLKLVTKLNSIAHIEGTSQIFKDDYAFASVINSKIKSNLEFIYDSSQWVTFINPRVDLSFFKNDKDVVIIHYTDQYSTSSGYDSITITNRWRQYETILKDYLNSKVDNLSNSIKPIINMFNAINGYWLLKLGSQNPNEKVDKEKISILSAVKELLVLLDHPNITWVVLSLEEILRVTGAAGLKQTQGIFSVSNLKKTGQFSDDILMIGLEEIEGRLQLYFYPVEVKIGHNSSQIIHKGKNQSQNTFELIIETLTQEGFTGKLYRNYFAKLILTAAQKLSLYEVWPERSVRWDAVEQWRGKLLNDIFHIGSLHQFIGDYALLSFKQNDTFSKRSILLNERLLTINLFQSDGLNDLVQSVSSLKDRYCSQDATGITNEDLLAYTYAKSEISNILDDKELIKRLSKIEEPEINYPSFQSLEDELTQDKAQILDDTIEPVITVEDTPEQEPSHAVSPLKILFGHQANNGKALEWFPTDPHKVMHTNTGIIGTMGTGKTQFTKSLITQLIRNTKDNVDGKKIGILIFDYKGDYIKQDFVNATGAKVFDLHQLPFNPFALSLGEKTKKLLPLHTASTFQETITKAFGLGNKQTLALIDVIMDAYANAGIFKNDPSSWSKPAPTLKDIFELYIEDEKLIKDSLYAALTKLYNFEIFESVSTKTKPLFELIDGVTIINLNENSPEIQNLIVAITLDQFYSQMQIDGHSKISGNLRQINKMILVDEADNFLGKNFESLKKILKEGREYGVGTILSTQFLNHFATGDNEYSQYILTWIIHRVNEIKDKEIYSIFDLPNKKDREDLIGEIKSLPIHHSIVNLAGSRPIRIKDKAFWELVQDV